MIPLLRIVPIDLVLSADGLFSPSSSMLLFELMVFETAALFISFVLIYMPGTGSALAILPSDGAPAGALCDVSAN